MKIAIDLDKTIFTCKSFLYNFLNKAFATRLKKRASYVVLNREQKEKPSKLKKLAKFFDAQNYIELEDCVSIINSWQAAGHEVIMISSRPNFKIIRELTLDCINEAKLNVDKVVIGCNNKLKYCQKENIDVLIDDNSEICRKCMQEGINCINYTLKNANEQGYLAQSWQKIKEIVQEMAEKCDIFVGNEKI